jgi:hypothetical protein
MGFEDRLMGDGLGFSQAIEAIEGGRTLKLLGQGPPRVLGDQVGGMDEPAGPAVIAELGGAEVDVSKAGRIGGWK